MSVINIFSAAGSETVVMQANAVLDKAVILEFGRARLDSKRCASPDMIN
jgi:hypothetical protein